MKIAAFISKVVFVLALFAVMPSYAAMNDGVKLGPNYVTVTVRHCQKYEHRHFFLWRWLGIKDRSMWVDKEACAADPSTIYYQERNHNLDTNAAKDYTAFLISATAGAPTAGAGNFLALSTNGTIAATDCPATATPATSTCTVTGEVVTAGLTRHAATFTRTGNGTYTLGYTWTAGASATGIQSAAIVTTATAGTSLTLYENTFTAISPNTGDTIQVTWSLTVN